ncbi:MAG: ATP-binding protein [Sphaerochaeta sp.]
MTLLPGWDVDSHIFSDTNLGRVLDAIFEVGPSRIITELGGKEACKSGYNVKYYRLPDLLEDLSLQGPKLGGRSKLIRRLQHFDLLILDEWMSSGLDNTQVAFIFELIESRYQNGSTIFCSQFAPHEWLSKLGGGPQADSITDRIVHESVFFGSGDLNMRETIDMQSFSKCST